MTRKTYKAREGAPFRDEDAQAIGEFVEENEGKTTEELLESVRKNRKCVLYQYIEWDDKKASTLFRLHQVRNIVNHLVIEIEEVGSRVPVRAFFSVQQKPQIVGNVYVSLDTSFSTEFYRKQIIERAKMELNNWTERYQQYEELSDLITVIREHLRIQSVETG